MTGFSTRPGAWSLRFAAYLVCVLPLLAVVVSAAYREHVTATGTYRGELYVGMASRPIRYLAVIGSLLLFRRDLRPSRWWLALYLWGWVAYFRYFLQT